MKNYCFACGEANPQGLRLKFDYDANHRTVECRLRIQKQYQGATGFAHGGMIATLLDEAMAKVNGKEGIRAVTLQLRVSYRKLVPVRKWLRLVGRHTKTRGRKRYLRSHLYDEQNNMLAEASGLFLTVSPNTG